MIEEKLYTLLSGATVITALTKTRIYPVKAPQNAKYPHLIYTRISGGQVNGLDGYLNLEQPRIQVDIYSIGYSQVKTLAENVHTTMNGATTFKSILISDNDFFEEEIDTYRVIMDYSCFNRE